LASKDEELQKKFYGSYIVEYNVYMLDAWSLKNLSYTTFLWVEMAMVFY